MVPLMPWPEPVVGDPDDRPRLAVVGQAGGHAGVVVLHALQLDPVQFHVLGRQVLGVQVVATTSGSTANRRRSA